MDFSARFSEIVSSLPGYEHRPGQLTMASMVRSTLHEGRHAVVEAGTGSGKSFGYLIPALETPGPIVISTGTIALQEQLLTKDLPFLIQHAYPGLDIALAKGRSHYLCVQKLWEADRTVGPLDPMRPQVDRMRAELPSWDGDVANLSFVPSPKLWDELQDTAEDCIGNACEFYHECPSRLAKQRVAKADVVVANHALYMTDLASGGALLPDHNAVVFDEAHHLPEAATRAFTVSIGRYAITKLLQKIRRRVGMPPERLLFELIDMESRLMEWVFRTDRASYRLYPDGEFVDIVSRLAELLSELRNWLDRDALRDSTELSDQQLSKAPHHRNRLLLQLDNLIARWGFFATEADATLAERVNWVELDRERGYFELKSAPLEVGGFLQDQMWIRRPAILTSATMAVDGDFSYFCRQVGLDAMDEVLELSLPSPFDFQRQATLYVPRFLPEPNAPEFANHSRDAIAHILGVTRGRALVLFTSYRAMRSAHAVLADRIPFPLKMQGELPRSALVDWFKRVPHAVLFATSSFWEGVDIPGEALSCVIIDRLPFSVPDDPVVQAQVERLKLQGRDWFREYTLPEAIIRLKQGFGRLIRTQSDRGLVAILDNRLFTKNYGSMILRALPDCPKVRDLEGFEI